MQEVICFFKHFQHSKHAFCLFASNYLYDVIIMSGAFKVKADFQVAAAFEVVTRYYFNSSLATSKKKINDCIDIPVGLKTCSFSNAMASSIAFLQSCVKPDKS